MTDKDCPHGQQPSTCYRCELERENARLRAADQARMGDRWNLEARVAELEAAVREVLGHIDSHPVGICLPDGAWIRQYVTGPLGAALGEGGEE